MYTAFAIIVQLLHIVLRLKRRRQQPIAHFKLAQWHPMQTMEYPHNRLNRQRATHTGLADAGLHVPVPRVQGEDNTDTLVTAHGIL